MRSNLLKNTIIAGVLCTALTIPAFAHEMKGQSILLDDKEVIPISAEFQHWSETYVDQLSQRYDTEAIFKDKNPDGTITVQDFQNLVKLVIDKEYGGEPDSLAREAVVHEFARIWAEKTGKDLDNIAVIKMLIYSDTDQIDAKYNHSVTVAYMRNIARGVGGRVFNPKAEVTYGELAALAFNTNNAVENELKPEVQAIAKGRFETKGSYEIKDGEVVLNFELMSHYTEAQELMFSSGQQFEVTITDEQGEEVYRYSDNRFFTMALVHKSIHPGEALTWQDDWDMTNKEGEKLTSGKYKVEIRIMVVTEEDDEIIQESELKTVLNIDLSSIQQRSME